MLRRPGTFGPGPFRAQLGGTPAARDPFVLLGADYAWRADDASVELGKVTALPSYIGNLELPATGTGQDAPVANADLNGQLAMPCVATSLGYGNVGLLGSPDAVTLVSVGRVTSLDWEIPGIAALVDGTGAINSGASQLVNAGLQRSRKLAGDVTSASVNPFNFCMVTVATSTDITGYHQSLTAVSSGYAAGMACERIVLCALGPGGYGMIGAWATTAVFLRALTADEAATCLTLLGTKYGIAIAP